MATRAATMMNTMIVGKTTTISPAAASRLLYNLVQRLAKTQD